MRFYEQKRMNSLNQFLRQKMIPKNSFPLNVLGNSFFITEITRIWPPQLADTPICYSLFAIFVPDNFFKSLIVISSPDDPFERRELELELELELEKSCCFKRLQVEMTVEKMSGTQICYYQLPIPHSRNSGSTSKSAEL
ncbi:MAG: hypothetical protein DRR08_03695 [Candidatus Parabeggiatoa sp. nov. 2]|nr:MAG: hypothetical protein DRR08_03695 [Gammaproteobacteria bacterium]